MDHPLPWTGTLPIGFRGQPMSPAPSEAIDVDDRIRKRPRSFLRQIGAEAASQEPVRVFAGELLCIRIGIRVWRTIGIAFERDGGGGDRRTCLHLPFQVVRL